jgi:hypothetical protein
MGALWVERCEPPATASRSPSCRLVVAVTTFVSARADAAFIAAGTAFVAAARTAAGTTFARTFIARTTRTAAWTFIAAFTTAFAFVAVVTAALTVFATRFVLVEAGAATAVFAVAATGKRQRAARA